MKKLLGKRFMFLVALLVGLCMPTMAQTQTSYTFNVASVNVEGVPQMLKNGLDYEKTANEHAIGAAGTKIISQKIAMQSWSIIGLCEDYNFHTDLTSAINNYYYYNNANPATLTSGSSRNNTDGLGILVAKSLGTANSGVKSNQYDHWENPSGGVNDSNREEYPNVADYSNPDELSRTGDNWAYRGWRRYEVKLPNSAVIDVYILHMDAGEDTQSHHKNTVARHNQIKSLTSTVISNANSLKRPAIVMGMTNSLYTREKLQELFIGAINANDNLTVNDAWVELIRGGKYPVYGTDAETPGNLYFDDQNGEVVNKIFYINNSNSDYTIKANSYLRDVANFSNLKNPPVVVNFTAAKKGEETAGTGSWTVSDKIEEVVTSDDFLGAQAPTNNKKISNCFLMNIGSGLYLKVGGAWATQATEGSGAIPVTIENTSGQYTLTTAMGTVFRASNTEIFMDNNTNNTWTFEQVSGKSYQYYIYKKNDGVEWALTSTGGPGNVISGAQLDRSNSRQKWVILTQDAALLSKIAEKASPTYPFDVTPFILLGSDFDQNGGIDISAWTNKGFTKHGVWNGDPAYYATLLYYYKTSSSAKTAFTVSKQSSINMPKGKYLVSFEGAYRARAYYWRVANERGNRNYELDVKVSMLNSSSSVLGSANVINENNIGFGDGDKDTYNFLFRDNDKYKNSFAFSMSNASTLKFQFDKPSFNNANTHDDGYMGMGDPRRFWVGIDNIVIKNLGTDNNSVKILVANYLYETAQKVKLLNEAGQAAYDVREVINRYKSNMLSADGSVEIAMIDAAYEIALRAHNAKEAQDALTNNNGDVTSLIVNPSFEQGATGWIIGNGSDAGVRDNVGAFYVDNAHSDVEGEEASQYQLYNGYNVWGFAYNASNNLNDWWTVKDGNLTTDVGAVSQIVTNLKNGLYELTAWVTSFPGNTVYIFGNDGYASAVAKSKDHLEKVTLSFLVEDGTAKIGAIGSFNGYYFTQGGFFKADNFSLKYICDAAHGRVKLALDEAKAVRETFDASGKAYQGLIDVLNEYDVKYNAGTIKKTDGTAEAAEIYNQLEAAALQQKTIGSDMSWCLGDPSFELGKYTADWPRMNAWDAKAGAQSDATYSAVGVDGSYLFNAWNPGTDIVPPLTKTITGLPNGTYRLSAMVTSDNGRTVYITGNGKYAGVVAQDRLLFRGVQTAEDGTTTDIYWNHEAKTNMFPVELEFEVTNGTATIGVVGGSYEDGSYASNGGCWYKVDDFHLKLLLLADNASQDEEQYAWDDVLYLHQDAEYIPELPRSAGGNTYNYKKVVLDRPVAGGVWNTFVVPFRMDYKNDVNCDLYGWEVKQLTQISLDETGQVVMSFADAPSIEPGVSYMVRKKDLADTLDVIEEGDGVNSVAVNTTFTTGGSSTHPTTTYTDKSGNITLTITGVYTNGYVPAGSYFINNNKFYQAKYEETNRLRGYRAYITIKDANGNARKLSFRIGESTGIDSTNNDEITIVGIYNLNGVRLTDMEPGVNILHMSDGTTMKVVIK